MNATQRRKARRAGARLITVKCCDRPVCEWCNGSGVYVPYTPGLHEVEEIQREGRKGSRYTALVVECPTCRGCGHNPHNVYAVCQRCDGDGLIPRPDSTRQELRELRNIMRRPWNSNIDRMLRFAPRRRR